MANSDYHSGAQWLGMLVVLATGLMICLGSCLSFKIPQRYSNVLPMSLAFSAGALIYLAFVEIWGSTVEGFEQVMEKEWQAHICTTLTFICGMIIGFMLDQIVHRIAPHSHTHTSESDDKNDIKQLIVNDGNEIKSAKFSTIDENEETNHAKQVKNKTEITEKYEKSIVYVTGPTDRHNANNNNNNNNYKHNNQESYHMHFRESIASMNWMATRGTFSGSRSMNDTTILSTYNDGIDMNTLEHRGLLDMYSYQTNQANLNQNQNQNMKLAVPMGSYVNMDLIENNNTNNNTNNNSSNNSTNPSSPKMEATKSVSIASYHLDPLMHRMDSASITNDNSDNMQNTETRSSQMIEENENTMMENAQCIELSAIDRSKLLNVSITTGIAVALHNFPEGLATFIGTLEDPAIGLAIAIGAAIHNIPLGISIATPIYVVTKSKWKAIGLTGMAGITQPIGGLIGLIVYQSGISDAGFSVMFGMTGGLILYTSVKELLPAARFSDPTDTYTSWLVLIGFLVIDISLVLLDSSESHH